MWGCPAGTSVLFATRLYETGGVAVADVDDNDADTFPGTIDDNDVDEDDVERAGVALLKLNNVTMPVDKPINRAPPAPVLLCAAAVLLADDDNPL
jgi:uncharacterized phage protein gp47/JayE